MAVQQEPDLFNLLDSEVDQIHMVLDAMRRKYEGSAHNYETFSREAEDRFGKLGFTVSVKWYEYSVEGARQEGAMPEIEITGRTAPKAFDHDQMVHEVTNDILGLGDKGVITTDRDTLKNFLGSGQGSHSHGDGHAHSH